jgi:hypothetical protein
VTLADERASKRGTQTLTYIGAPVPDPTKWIKQHLRIKKFYGTSENAVKSQIWIAVSVYVLVAIVKKRLNLDASLYTLLQILSLTLFEKMPIQQAFAGNDLLSNQGENNNQMNLFAF